MKKKNLFKLTIVFIIIIYVTLFLVVENFEKSKFYYQSMILVGGIAFLINLFLGKKDNDDSDNKQKIISKSQKIITYFIIIVIIIVAIWILGIVEL